MKGDALATALENALGVHVDLAAARTVHGGSIHRALRVPTATLPIFLKLAPLEDFEALAAEEDGLEALRAAAAVRVPAVLALLRTDEHACLALEWLELEVADAGSEARLGEQLARLHRTSAAEFGWHRANTIGASRQPNDPSPQWTDFFRDRRLRFQLELAATRRGSRELLEHGERVCESIDQFFRDYLPQPSLLHGDLWGGNWGTVAGEPVIFDPAVYYGDREADLAMTRLFGGFGAAFYRAYEHAWPLAEGAGARVELYNLYHVLNHYNLFGGGYEQQALRMMQRLLRIAATR